MLVKNTYIKVPFVEITPLSCSIIECYQLLLDIRLTVDYKSEVQIS